MGLLPARAHPRLRGEHRQAPSCSLTPRAHPRLRGEHGGGANGHTAMQGSSPPTRGAHATPGVWGAPNRLIPAYAGSTTRLDAGLLPSAAHPRLRGEHGVGFDVFPETLGSSPPTRGARSGDAGGFLYRGLIPAYAGSTILVAGSTVTSRAHPRLRGEHAFACSFVLRV